MYEIVIRMRVSRNLINEAIKEEKVPDRSKLSEVLCNKYLKIEGVEECAVEIIDKRFKDETRN